MHVLLRIDQTKVSNKITNHHILLIDWSNEELNKNSPVGSNTQRDTVELCAGSV